MYTCICVQLHTHEEMNVNAHSLIYKYPPSLGPYMFTLTTYIQDTVHTQNDMHARTHTNTHIHPSIPPLQPHPHPNPNPHIHTRTHLPHFS